MDLHRIPIALAAVLAVVLIVAKYAVIGDARWWNLVMAALLVLVLVVFLRSRQRQS